MTTVINARDQQLQATVPRVAGVTLADNIQVSQANVEGLGLIVEGSKQIWLATTSPFFQIPKVGSIVPSTISLTANVRNLVATPTLTIKAGSGTMSVTPALTSGVFTFTETQMTSDFITFVLTVVEGGITYTDEMSIAKLREGSDGIVGLLTNESHTLPADYLGNITSYVGASGNFKVYQGITDVTTACTFSVIAGGNPDSLTYTLNPSGMFAGTYSVTSGYPTSVGVTTLTMRATFGTFVVDKVFTISKAKNGTDGATAELMVLLASAYTFTFDGTGAAAPSGQVITFTAVDQNLTGSPSFTATGYNASGTSLGAITLSGTGEARTMNLTQFGAAAFAVVTATWGGFSDQITVVRLKDGVVGRDGIVGFLTNEAVTIATAEDGTGGSFSGAGGTFKVFDGLVDKTGNGAVTYSVLSAGAVSISIASTGVYTVSGVSADQSTAILRANYLGLNIDKAYTIVKSRAGATGADGVNSASVYIYQRTTTSTPPSVPSASVTYTFATAVATGLNNGWSQTLPTTGGTYRWITQASALSTGTTDTIATGEWATPAIFSQDGLDGASGIAYWITGGGAAIQKSTGGTYTPSAVTFGAMSAASPSAPAAYSGRFVIATSTDGTSYTTQYTSSADESSKSYTVPASIKTIRCRLYLAGGTTTLLDEVIIPIVTDGFSGGAGADSLSVAMSNEAHVLPAAADGTVGSYTGSGTEIRVFQGSTELTYDGVGTSNGTWKITSATTNITRGSLTDSGTYLTVGDHSGVAFGTDTAKIDYSIIGTSSAGISFTIVKSQTFSKSKSGVDGANSTSYWMSRSASAIQKSITNVYTPSAVTFSAFSAAGTGSPGAYAGRFVIATTTDGSTYTTQYTSATNESSKAYTIPAGIVALRVRLYLAGGTTTLLDEEVVPVVFDGGLGQDAVNAVLSNEAHVFPALVDGSVSSYGGSGTTLRVYEGAVELAYDGTGTANGTWKFVATPTNITVGSTTDSGLFATIGTASGVAAGTDTSAISFAISGKTSLGVSFSLTKVQTFSKSKAGTPGDDGLDSTAYWLARSAAAIKKSLLGVYTPSAVTFAAYTQSGAGSPAAYAGRFIIATSNDGTTYTTVYTSATNESSKTYTIPAGIATVRVRLYLAGGTTLLLDEEIVPVVVDGDNGVDGANGLSVILSNEAHVLPASPTGVVSSYVGSGTTVRVYEGATELSYQPPGTGPGTYTISTATTNVTVGSITDSGVFATVGVASGVAAGTDTAAITFTITGKLANGSAFSVTKVQTFSKSKAGDDGNDGLNSAIVYLYQRATATPVRPTGDIVYTFVTGSVTGALGLWSRTIPAGTNPIYVTIATASGLGTTDTIAAGEWATPVVLAQNGSNGTPGIDGERGSRTFYVALSGVTATYSDSLATTTASVEGGPILNDVVTQYNNSVGFSQTKFWNGTSWSIVNAVIDGNLLVSGTIGTAALAANAVTAVKIDARDLTLKNSLGEVIFDANTVLGTDSASTMGFNPTFSAWTGTYPANWATFAGAAPTKETAVTLNSPFSVEWTTTGANLGMSCIYTFENTKPMPAGSFIQGCFTVRTTSGSITGRPGYLVRLYTASDLSTYVDTPVQPDGSTAANAWCRMPFVAGAGGAVVYAIRIYQMAGWTGFAGGVTAAGAIVRFGPFTFEVREPITSATAGVYMESAAINLAQINVASIGQLSALSATIGTLRTATSGGRVEIQDNKIRVYDTTNAVRVMIGYLL